MREETRVDLYSAGVKPHEYDESCKRVFKNKEIIAPDFADDGAGIQKQYGRRSDSLYR